MDKKAPLDPNLAAAAIDPAEPIVRPVRSAKDAINAMYAQNSDHQLSDYLAMSAKDIINSDSHATGDSKSAASLHRKTSRQRLNMARPSASGMLRTAPVEEAPVAEDVSHAMDPLAQKSAPAPAKRRSAPKASTPSGPAVIKTSLRLAPKKAPAARPRTLQTKSHSSGLSINGQKGPTTLSKMWAERRAEARQAPHKTTTDSRPTAANAREELQVMQDAVKKVTKKPTPPRRASGALMQDVVRQPRNVDGFIRPVSHATSSQPSTRPADSVKRRFKTIPKDYVAHAETQADSYEGFEPDPGPDKPPVEIYGMMDEEPTGKGNTSGLGVVEDYHPQGDRAGSSLKEQKVATGTGSVSAPDNNKHVLGGSSPFFLKSVNVEKRPLSDAPFSAKQNVSEGTLYERPSSAPVSNKNVYEKKETQKALPTKPTVIIPAARKSKAPLVFLLILTIILGAAVGAFVYLCFFQYME